MVNTAVKFWVPYNMRNFLPRYVACSHLRITLAPELEQLCHSVHTQVMEIIATCEDGIFICIFSFHLLKENIHEVSWIICFQH